MKRGPAAARVIPGGPYREPGSEGRFAKGEGLPPAGCLPQAPASTSSTPATTVTAPITSERVKLSRR